MIKEILVISAKSIVSLLILFLLAKTMGKKQIAQLTLFDYVVGISIGSIAAELAINESVSYIQGITSMFIYALFPIIVSVISLKSRVGRKILDGVPTILIQNGIINEDGLRKNMMNVNDLLEECRLKDIFDIRDIEFAILETSGKLSVQLKAKNKAITMKDMNIITEDSGLCVNLIIDGKIIHEHLKLIKKDSKWLLEEINAAGIKSEAEVLLANIDHLQKVNIYLKNKDIPTTPIF